MGIHEFFVHLPFSTRYCRLYIYIYSNSVDVIHVAIYFIYFCSYDDPDVILKFPTLLWACIFLLMLVQVKRTVGDTARFNLLIVGS